MLNLAATRFAQTIEDAQPIPGTEASESLSNGGDVPTTTVDLDAQQIEQGAAILGGMFMFMIFVGIVLLISFIFAIIAIIHLIRNSDVPNRILWIVLSFFIPFVGIFYLLGPRRTYNRNKGAHGSENPLSQVNNNPAPLSQPAAPSAQQPVIASTPEPATPVTSPTAPVQQNFTAAPQPAPAQIQPQPPVQEAQAFAPQPQPQVFAPQPQPVQAQAPQPAQPQPFQQPQPQVFSPDVTPPQPQNSNPDNRI